MKYKIYLNYEDYAERLSMYVTGEKPNGARYICTDLNNMAFEEMIMGEADVTPTLILKGMIAKPFLQAFVDSAKVLGITPTGDPISENELVATKYHLEDMRRLALVDVV